MHANGDEVSKRGKGYGEEEILAYAMEHSSIINTGQCFYKITGRLTISNIKQLKLTDKAENLFVFDIGNKLIDTRFYKVCKNDYNNYIKSEYLRVDDRAGYFLEHAFFEGVYIHRVKFARFCTDICFEGQSGTTGKSYSSEVSHSLVKEIIYSSFLYKTYFGRAVLKVIRRIKVKE